MDRTESYQKNRQAIDRTEKAFDRAEKLSIEQKS